MRLCVCNWNIHVYIHVGKHRKGDKENNGSSAQEKANPGLENHEGGWEPEPVISKIICIISVVEQFKCTKPMLVIYFEVCLLSDIINYDLGD